MRGGLGRPCHWHGGGPEGGSERPWPACWGPVLPSRHRCDSSETTDQARSLGDSEGTEDSPKVPRARRTELELSGWRRGPRAGHRGLRPWRWGSSEATVTKVPGARAGEGSSFSPGAERHRSIHLSGLSRAAAPSGWRFSSSSALPAHLRGFRSDAPPTACQPCSFSLIDN